MVRKKIILALLILAALAISASAAFFSVYGLSKVFAGASLAVIIMASVLEGAKLITAYSLHEYAKVIPKIFKIYLTVAVIVLMLITSAGIYGFLSNAYQITSNRYQISTSEIGIIEARQENLTARLEDYKNEQSSIIKDITELRTGLSSGTTVQYTNENGEVITTTSSAVRKSLENQLQDAISRRDQVGSKIENTSAQIDSLKIEVLQMQANDDAAAELGPLIYLSNVTGLEMDQVMNYFILMIVFVFDPLAVCLVISISYIGESLGKRKEESITVFEEPIVELNENPFPTNTKYSGSFVSDEGTKVAIPFVNEEGTYNLNLDQDLENIPQEVFIGTKAEPEEKSPNPTSASGSLYEKYQEFENKKKVPDIKVKVIRKNTPVKKNVDNGHTVVENRITEEIIKEPVKENENISDDYIILGADKLANMTDEEIKEWYSQNKKIKLS